MATLQSSSLSSSAIRHSPIRLSSHFPRFNILSSLRNVRPCGVLSVVCQAQHAALHLGGVNEKTWDSSVVKAESPVLVEFWAPWCGPCRIIQPLMDELSTEYAGKIKCFKLNTDECPSIATKYGIRSIPTVIIFVNGEKKYAVTGAVPKSTLTAAIHKFL